MTVAAVFWLVGLGCLIAALAGKGVKISTVELPAFAAAATRIGAAAVGAVALGLGTLLFFEARDGGSAPVTAGSTTRPPTQGAPRTEGPAANNDDLAVLWQGTMTVADGRGVDVGHMPVEVGGIVGSSFYLYDGYVNGALSEWTGESAPTATDCANQLRTHPADRLRPKDGLGFCTVGDTATRVAFVRITSYALTAPAVEIDVTIWNLQL